MTKKIALVLLFTLISALGGSLFAADESELYVKSVMIDKIYSYEYGYRVIYIKSDMSRGETFIPNKWMHDENKTLSVEFGYGPSYPYMTIWWKDGKFYRIKLYVIKNFSHYTWGTVLSDEKDRTEDFNVDTLNIDF